MARPCDHFIGIEHFRFEAEAVFVFPIIEPRRAAHDNQHDLIALPKRERLCDLRFLGLMGRGGFRHRGRARLGHEHLDVGGMIGKELADRLEAHGFTRCGGGLTDRRL